MNIPEHLKRQLFPWIEVVKQSNQTEDKVTHVKVLQFFEKLREIIIEDAPILMHSNPGHPIWDHPAFKTNVFAYYCSLHYGGSKHKIEKGFPERLPTLTMLQSLTQVWMVYNKGFGGFKALKYMNGKELLNFKRGYARRKAWERLITLVKYIVAEAKKANINCSQMATLLDSSIKYSSLNQIIRRLKNLGQ